MLANWRYLYFSEATAPSTKCECTCYSHDLILWTRDNSCMLALFSSHLWVYAMPSACYLHCSFRYTESPVPVLHVWVLLAVCILQMWSHAQQIALHIWSLMKLSQSYQFFPSSSEMFFLGICPSFHLEGVSRWIKNVSAEEFWPQNSVSYINSEF